MTIYSYASFGYEGELVTVEVDLRPALPGFEIVGLPDSAIREARERIRVAIRNSGFEYPTRRILVNLYPAGIPKTGAAFDLPIALGILAASGAFVPREKRILALGELQLSGRVRGVPGVIAALDESRRLGDLTRLVPEENLAEAEAAGNRGVRAVTGLRAAAALVSGWEPERPAGGPAIPGPPEPEEGGGPDYGDMYGCRGMIRAMQIAAAGGHHVMLCGAPGSGKSMAALRFPSLLPSLSREEAVEVTRIYSLAGKLSRRQGLIRSAPFRKPHHSASREGVIGGGATLLPGEVSLAHRGALLLDEAAEFQAGVLQALREPIEQRRVELARAGRRAWFPAAFQLLLTLNPCPCGNLGREDGVCLCSERELHRYWRTIGGALIDRVDIRLAVSPADPAELLEEAAPDQKRLAAEVEGARRFATVRRQSGFNAELQGATLARAALLGSEGKRALLEVSRREGLSNRAVHGLLRVARTVADLAGREEIEKSDVEEAVAVRLFGENPWYSGLSLRLGA